MRPDDQVRLRHLREAANKAIGYSKGKQRNATTSMTTNCSGSR